MIDAITHNLSSVELKPKTPKCGKHGCDRLGVRSLWHDLFYYACNEHYGELVRISEGNKESRTPNPTESMVTYPSSGVKIPYAVIRAAVRKSYHMKLRSKIAVAAVVSAVNQSIDSYLEACYIRDRGDSFTMDDTGLNCTVSAESLPVLLRRLSEMPAAEGDNDEDCGASIASAIFDSLRIDDRGKFIGGV